MDTNNNATSPNSNTNPPFPIFSIDLKIISNIKEDSVIQFSIDPCCTILDVKKQIYSIYNNTASNVISVNNIELYGYKLIYQGKILLDNLQQLKNVLKIKTGDCNVEDNYFVLHLVRRVQDEGNTSIKDFTPFASNSIGNVNNLDIQTSSDTSANTYNQSNNSNNTIDSNAFITNNLDDTNSNINVNLLSETLYYYVEINNLPYLIPYNYFNDHHDNDATNNPHTSANSIVINLSNIYEKMIILCKILWLFIKTVFIVILIPSDGSTFSNLLLSFIAGLYVHYNMPITLRRRLLNPTNDNNRNNNVQNNNSNADDTNNIGSFGIVDKIKLFFTSLVPNNNSNNNINLQQ